MSKLYIVLIAGGRGGDHMSTDTADLDGLDLTNEETIEDILEGEYCYEGSYLAPNQDSDIPNMVKVMKGEEDMFFEWDSFGEGVIGITTKKSLRKDLAAKTRAYFNDVDDNPEWDD